MSFNSWQFLVFLPVVILFYYILPHKVRWVWLLAASYFFYMSWNPWLIFLIISTTLVSYLSGLFMEKTEKPGIKKLLLVATIVICLGLLVFFKYANFLTDSVYAIIRLFVPKIESPSLNILLPIGISFYTFQTLSYVIDTYRGKYKAERHLGYYALFVSFFPQLVAGPIERPDKLIPQLKEKHKFDLDDFLIGFRIMVCGFFYKIVVADFTGIFVNNVYGDLSHATSLSVFLASLLFCIQIYGDFNGYSEIAVGSARMLGIHLTQNFNRPYASRTYAEFFRRWHISLNYWFTSYVYIPLGGNRKGKFRKELNVLIVFLLCGLWHGADWTFVLWGGCAAIFLIMEDLLSDPVAKLFGKMGISPTSKPILAIRHFFFFVFLPLSAIFFRSANLAQAFEAYRILFTVFPADFFPATFASLGIGIAEALFLVVDLAFMELLISLSFINRKAITEPTFSTMSKKKLCLHVATIGLAIACIAFMWAYGLGNGGSSQFAYFQF